jgi:hypothetical protein
MNKSNKIEHKENIINKNFISLTQNNINKKKEFLNNLNNYNLIEFNLNQLIKKDSKNKIIINVRKTPNYFKKNKIVINKNRNITESNKSFLRSNPIFWIKNNDFKNNIKKNNTIEKYKSLEILKTDLDFYF